MGVIDTSQMDSLEQSIGYHFVNRALLQDALTHPSYANDQGGGGGGDYQRLEFLGDSVLALVLADLLTLRYPDWDEGQLSRFSHWLYDQTTLASVARELELGPLIMLGRSQGPLQGRSNDSILADVFEAVVGALFRDSSYETVRAVIGAIFAKRLETPYESIVLRDPKSELLEQAAARGLETPRFEPAGQSGPPHAPLFRFKVVIGDTVMGNGEGKSKKAAQQAAAGEALAMLTGYGEQRER